MLTRLPPWQGCCAPYHRGAAAVPTAEAMLRSRYSAYAAKDPQYIADTTHPDSPEFVGSRSSYTGAVKQTMRRLDPLKLTILKEDAGASADESFITFKLNRRIRDPEVPRNAPEVGAAAHRSQPPSYPRAVVDNMDSRAYIGQFSEDGQYFVAAFQDRRVRLYDVERGWRLRKDITTRMCRSAGPAFRFWFPPMPPVPPRLRMRLRWCT
ncbi:LEC14B protein [Tetrabaena socialis]|uniref:LEC14B protein n=1 Tax=Tetrabaena socialis TaxID=47790 RepID=A0A2J7ZQR1_9CHLO|nr:LEC14B protein [Tetrabaena socialis]|eukprot:PNH02599.1 LEC14B protein [Tetrabaena socialis]